MKLAKHKKFIAVFLIFSFLAAVFPFPAYADFWGANWVATHLERILEEMYLKIKESIIATLKMQAIRTIQGRMMSLLGGGGQPQIVTNWRETIYGSANKEASLVVNDYFSSTKSGSGPGGQKIVSAGEQMYNADPRSVKPTIDRYVPEGRVDKIFDRNYTPNPTQALVDLSKMRNYPVFYTATAQSIYAVEYGEKAGSEAAKNIAYGGVKGTGDTGSSAGKQGEVEKITMPGSVKRDVFSQIMSMPTNMVTLARSIPEIVAAMVTQMLTQTVNRGFSMMNRQIDRQMSTFRGQFGGSVPQVQYFIRKGIR
ncbi:MAG: hypothetical protein QMD77_02800 [Patescibacteria group bacterium]|nr:hypothetical protein [Patescibacteria group bacterium]